MNLARFPRLRFAHLPTPLEPMESLTRHLGGPRLWVKRDDCTGLATGGNKTRKLEFLMGDALDKGADTILTQGAIQSNHARQTAAISARLGLDCHVLLQDRTGFEDDAYKLSGNVLLDGLFGAQMSWRASDVDMEAELAGVADDLRAKGKTPYVIPGGGSSPVGALGYANAALEIVSQATDMGLKIAHIVHATGSATTQSGLLIGLKALNSGIPVLGIGIRDPREIQESRIYGMVEKASAHMGLEDVVAREDVVANCDYYGQGYGLPTEGMAEAVKLVARTEGILLDPVYSGKAMAGLIDLIGKGQFEKDSDVVFIHTGGMAALFGYPNAFDLPGYQ